MFTVLSQSPGRSTWPAETPSTLLQSCRDFLPSGYQPRGHFLGSTAWSWVPF